MKTKVRALILLCIISTIIVSCNDNRGNESNDRESISNISDSDFSSVLSQDNLSQTNNELLPWEIPEDIENPSQGLELAETYSKEFGDCYVVTGIGTCTDEDLVIPSTVNGIPVTEIANNAFFGNNRIKSVYCGNRVTKIGKMAFQECKNLKKVVIPNSVITLCEQAFARSGVIEVTMSDRITTMERAVFTSCESLKKVKLPLLLAVIPESTCNSCAALTDVELSPNTVSIADRAFTATALKTIRLPASVESIDPNAFKYTPLQSFEVEDGNPYFCSVDGVLYSKDKSTLVIYPQARSAYTVPDGVIMIDNGAFYRNAYTSFEVTLPDSIKTIGSSAFIMEYSCTLKVSIKKGLAYIDNYAFTCLYGIATINFEGTKEEWNAISKAEYWYAPYLCLGDQTIRVNCTDGALTFEYKMQ